MDDFLAKILFLVEGEKMEPKIMKHILTVYGLSERYEIIPYRTNIYNLYKMMFSEGHPEDWDLLQILKSRSKDCDKWIFDYQYSDIVLIFDLEAHHPGFTAEKIKEMASYFVESSDMGKLYINYPMVESFFHMKSVPDMEYNSYEIIASDILQKGQYKNIAKKVCRCSKFDDFFKRIQTRETCGILIKQNLNKALLMVNRDNIDASVPEQKDILLAEMSCWKNEQKIKVLCTCVFFIVDYNYQLVF